MLLPITLISHTAILEYVTLQPSISDYYYTSLREIFTGELASVGFFLILYKGYKNKRWWLNDSLLTNIAGFMAIGVAIFPTFPPPKEQKLYTLIPLDTEFLGCLHYAFAAVLFLIFALLCFFVFRLGQKRDLNIPTSIFDENNIYMFCGIIILLCILAIPICNYYFKEFKHATLVFETIALFAFSFSWLIKGRFIGGFLKRTNRVLYGEN